MRKGVNSRGRARGAPGLVQEVPGKDVGAVPVAHAIHAATPAGQGAHTVLEQQLDPLVLVEVEHGVACGVGREGAGEAGDSRSCKLAQ